MSQMAAIQAQITEARNKIVQYTREKNNWNSELFCNKMQLPFSIKVEDKMQLFIKTKCQITLHNKNPYSINKLQNVIL